MPKAKILKAMCFSLLENVYFYVWLPLYIPAYDQNKLLEMCWCALSSS